jgi:hypothetical protein
VRKPIIYPYSMKSKSARLLSSALQTKRVYPNRAYKPHQTDLVVNWGASAIPLWLSHQHGRHTGLNTPSAVALACNKLHTFSRLEVCNVPTPDWTVDKEQAMEWAEDTPVVCRTLLSSHSGKGIVIASTPSEIVAAPLYTKLVQKDKEWRVHVFKGNILDIQQKKRRNGVEASTAVRNHSNGWIYARDGVIAPISVLKASIEAVASLGLDFGAVDVCTSLEGAPYVFEVNTAPGLTGTTLTNYVEAITEVCNA